MLDEQQQIVYLSGFALFDEGALQGERFCIRHPSQAPDR
jgi:hypothetical protein